ncbi:MAG: ribosome-associated translation inhibitor RaiA [Candidatus Binatia bacterium]
MQIDIRGHRMKLTDALRAHIERRLRFALGRFGARIMAGTVIVEDLNGPRGGIDKQCRIAVALKGSGHVRVEVRDTDMISAVDHAADRINRAVTRELDRRRPYPTYRPITSRVPGAVLFQRRGRTSHKEGAA